MAQIQIFDPAMCCSSGVCGTDVDQQLINFAADVAWLEQQGGQIERFNLAQQPLEFANNPQVSAFLMRSGEAGLPLILLDNEIVLAGRYAKREELARWAGVAMIPVVIKSIKKAGCCGSSGCC